MDILATNRMARALLTDFDARPPRERNPARWIFLDPATRELHIDWPVVARENVAILRHDVAQHPDDPQLRELTGELSMAGPAPGGPSTTSPHATPERSATGTPSSAR